MLFALIQSHNRFHNWVLIGTNRRAARVFGVVSFSGYLWHAVVLENLGWLPFPIGSAAAAATVLGLIVAVSVWSYVLIERPFLRIGLRRRAPRDAGARLTQSAG